MVKVTPRISVRPSKSEDAPQLLALDHLAWNHFTAPSETKWTSPEEYLEKSPPGTQLVAAVEKTVFGYVSVRNPTPLKSNSHVGELTIAVHPSYQGLGVGKALMEEVEKRAYEEGKSKLSLRVLATNPFAAAFYKSLGYEEQGRLENEFYIDGEYVDDLLMYKFL
ncbi:GNAT family N-acetyltransferase [Pseudalkalibacillus caeni]|uniref:GNAT family N-acetyltransferase n=1 Tax=Exobacillus caeni TaxID=2574798 RepID=A0A5R9FED3_9BACL|nr:GNAT family N-acetyltransferase [Pseudalkalibacillus caeni]TLS38924.1 GNAT family N-acetyltransferase [Pseudalkalibacillus caeni]